MSVGGCVTQKKYQGDVIDFIHKIENKNYAYATSIVENSFYSEQNVATSFVTEIPISAVRSTSSESNNTVVIVIDLVSGVIIVELMVIIILLLKRKTCFLLNFI